MTLENENRIRNIEEIIRDIEENINNPKLIEMIIKNRRRLLVKMFIGLSLQDMFSHNLWKIIVKNKETICLHYLHRNIRKKWTQEYIHYLENFRNELNDYES